MILDLRFAGFELICTMDGKETGVYKVVSLSTQRREERITICLQPKSSGLASRKVNIRKMFSRQNC